jgi:hypothetical protein
MDTNTLVENQIAILGPEYRDFVEGSFIGIAAGTFGDQLSFSPHQTDILENAIFLFMVLILDREEAIEFISNNCGLPPAETELIWTAIESSLPEGMLPMITGARQKLQAQVPSNTQPPSQNLAHEIEEAEHELASIQGIRTMATDMRSTGQFPPMGEVVHSSSQADILPTPSGPKWDETERSCGYTKSGDHSVAALCV